MWECASNNLGELAKNGEVRSVTRHEAEKKRYTVEFKGRSVSLTGGKLLMASVAQNYEKVPPLQAPTETSLFQQLKTLQERPVLLCDIAKEKEVAWLVDGLSLIFYATRLYVRKYYKEASGRFVNGILQPKVGEEEEIYKFLRDEAGVKLEGVENIEGENDVYVRDVLSDMCQRLEKVDEQPHKGRYWPRLRGFDLHEAIFYNKWFIRELDRKGRVTVWERGIGESSIKTFFCNGLGDLYSPMQGYDEGITTVARGLHTGVFQLIAPVSLLTKMKVSERHDRIGAMGDWVLGSLHEKPFVKGPCQEKEGRACLRQHFVLRADLSNQPDEEYFCLGSKKLQEYTNAVVSIMGQDYYGNFFLPANVKGLKNSLSNTTANRLKLLHTVHGGRRGQENPHCAFDRNKVPSSKKGQRTPSPSPSPPPPNIPEHSRPGPTNVVSEGVHSQPLRSASVNGHTRSQDQYLSSPMPGAESSSVRYAAMPTPLYNQDRITAASYGYSQQPTYVATSSNGDGVPAAAPIYDRFNSQSQRRTSEQPQNPPPVVSPLTRPSPLAGTPPTIQASRTMPIRDSRASDHSRQHTNDFDRRPQATSAPTGPTSRFPARAITSHSSTSQPADVYAGRSSSSRSTNMNTGDLSTSRPVYVSAGRSSNCESTDIHAGHSSTSPSARISTGHSSTLQPSSIRTTHPSPSHYPNTNAGHSSTSRSASTSTGHPSTSHPADVTTGRSPSSRSTNTNTGHSSTSRTVNISAGRSSISMPTDINAGHPSTSRATNTSTHHSSAPRPLNTSTNYSSPSHYPNTNAGHSSTSRSASTSTGHSTSPPNRPERDARTDATQARSTSTTVARLQAALDTTPQNTSHTIWSGYPNPAWPEQVEDPEAYSTRVYGVWASK